MIRSCWIPKCAERTPCKKLFSSDLTGTKNSAIESINLVGVNVCGNLHGIAHGAYDFAFATLRLHGQSFNTDHALGALSGGPPLFEGGKMCPRVKKERGALSPASL